MKNYYKHLFRNCFIAMSLLFFGNAFSSTGCSILVPNTNLQNDGFQFYSSIGQSFSPTCDGQISSVQFVAASSTTIQMEILQFSANGTSTTTLGFVDGVASSSAWNFVFPTPIQVQSGTNYYIRFTNSSQLLFNYSTNDPISSGQMFINNAGFPSNFDLALNINIETTTFIPPPACEVVIDNIVSTIANVSNYAQDFIAPCNASLTSITLPTTVENGGTLTLSLKTNASVVGNTIATVVSTFSNNEHVFNFNPPVYFDENQKIHFYIEATNGGTITPKLISNNFQSPVYLNSGFNPSFSSVFTAQFDENAINPITSFSCDIIQNSVQIGAQVINAGQSFQNNCSGNLNKIVVGTVNQPDFLMEVFEGETPSGPPIATSTQTSVVGLNLVQFLFNNDVLIQADTQYNFRFQRISNIGFAVGYEVNNQIPNGKLYLDGVPSETSDMRFFVSLSEVCLTPAPSAPSTFHFANGQTISDINVQGTNLKWYDVDQGGTELLNTTSLMDNTTLYVSQTLNGCEGPRLAIDLIETILPAGSLRPNFCNENFPSFASNIYAVTISGSDEYQFEVTNTVTQEIEIITTTNRFFKIVDLTSEPMFNTPYSVRVRIVRNGQIGPFGSACQITIIANPIQLRAVSCGVQLTNMASLIHAESFNGAEQFQFEVTNVTTSEISVFTSNTRSFNLTQLSQTPQLFTEYLVRVRPLKNGNALVDYGNVCSVFSPFNQTQLRGSSCGALLPNRFTPIYANTVVNASEYEFEVTDLTTQIAENITRQVRVFHLGLLNMEIHFDRVYSIRVRAIINGQPMPFGNPCTVTTPVNPNQAMRNTQENMDLSLSNYPNPFDNTTILTWSNLANIETQIWVFDMTGKIVGEFKTNSNSLELGQNLNTGIYLVKIQIENETYHRKIVKK